ncbi:uncharacterized protein MEPE_02651 [Melanopsichium pennsylvanicum]|uniref:Acyltransferase 3 domain-containing protein n=2 Tax=Melanopsichium pennsylvanicum TaxID=63383 RepID=A0AAJ4XKU1_9BASI|nr:conserved hypothetical protein [Melanopsichium pennsylvanicum 4]SNX83943.1 uncharacterized protein MEPE_02651 [Melanopsichium pennsylvanicum]
MASRYSLTAELPATRKSLRRSIQNSDAANNAFHPPLPTQSHQQPHFEGDEKLSVPFKGAWNTDNARNESDHVNHTVRRNLSLRRGATRGESRKGGNGGADSALKSDFDTTNVIYDHRGYRVLKGEDRFGLTSHAFTEETSNDEGRSRRSRLAYLEGLRGVLGLQVLVWTFFRIFAPAIVADRDVDGVYPAQFLSRSPEWQTLLRKVLSPVLFDGELQAAFFVILSGRASLQTFIERRVAISLAGAAFKRPFRFLLPMAVTLGLVSMVIAVNGFRYASEVSTALGNQIAQPPSQWGSALEYFNSLLFFFSTSSYYRMARATQFIPPSGTLWIVPVLFQQTYVMIILAFALPYTVVKYKNLGIILLILTTAWVGRWSWYTLTGLLLAEWSTIYLQLLPAKGIPLNRRASRHVPVWLPGVIFLALGVFSKYIWVAAFPEAANREIIAHVDGNTGKLNYDTDPAQVAFPRYDNWMLATGVLYLVEISPSFQRVFAAKPLAYLGRWSFSIALISGTVMLSLGSLIRHHLTVSAGWSSEAAVLGVLFLCLIPTCCGVAEMYSRIIDDASLFGANWIWKWIRV